MRDQVEENMRLLEARPRRDGIADRAQRMAENGEALEYIELVLQQLQRASKDHRRLVQQRHADFRYEFGEGSVTRFEGINERVVRMHRDRRGEVPTDVSKVWSRSSSGPWESDLTSGIARQPSECPRPDVTTRLLTKRRNYGGTAQSTFGTLRPGPARCVQDGINAAAYQGFTHVPEDVGWKSAKETLSAWGLPETPSSSDRRTSSTVV